MKRALIVTGFLEGARQLQVDHRDYDCVICADKGLLIARDLGLSPDLLIGDYDSMEQPQEPNLIKLPRVKDMTDCEAAIDLAASRGYTDLTVLGGLGGRFDHTMGNIAMLKKYLDKALSIRLMDGQNLVFLRGPGRLSVAACGYTYLGLIAYDSPCTGLSLRGTKYTLTDYTLTNDTSLCVSNEIIGGTAEISFCSGTLLVILSRDRG